MISGATVLLLLAIIGIGYALYGSDTNVRQRAAGGGTKVIAVELTDFDVRPGTLEVDRGMHVVLEVTNTGDQDHELAFEGGRLHTCTLTNGQSQRLDLGTVTRQLESWCTLPFHKTLGMKLHVEVVERHPDEIGRPQLEGRTRRASVSPRPRMRRPVRPSRTTAARLAPWSVVPERGRISSARSSGEGVDYRDTDRAGHAR